MDAAAALDALVKPLVEHFHCLLSPVPTSAAQPEDQRGARVSWRDFVARLQRFHSSPGRRCVSVAAIDCCRVLYHFDVACDGRIDAQLFLHHVIAALQEHFAKDAAVDASTSGVATSRSPQPQQKLAVAVKSAKRPDADAFSTPHAVRKLFLARAQQQKQHMQRQAKPKSAATASANAAAARAKLHALLYAGNTRIRSLPVTKLLGHGVHFRPQRTRRKLACQSDDDECFDAHQLQ